MTDYFGRLPRSSSRRICVLKTVNPPYLAPDHDRRKGNMKNAGEKYCVEKNGKQQQGLSSSLSEPPIRS